MQGKNQQGFLKSKFNFWCIFVIYGIFTIIKKNIHLLQILDSIKYIKKIPDTTIKASCLRFLEIVRTLTLDDKKELIRLSLKYPPSTRALLGTLLDETHNKSMTDRLKESLNPITKYEIPDVGKIFTKASNWNIIWNFI